MNGFFRWDDPKVSEVAGYALPHDWWSRPYEYAWALGFAKPGQVVADMGCGWMYRPFKDALAGICEHVYAVDQNSRLLAQSRPDNMTFVIANFSQKIEALEAGSLDAIFCISVLEDLGDFAGHALKEFGRLLKDDGLVVITFDAPYDDNNPTPVYPGLPLHKFNNAVRAAGLRHKGMSDYRKDNAVNHGECNLSCFHCVLEKR